MNTKELQVILEKHKKWLSDEAGGESADLRANLEDAYLRGANLEDANLVRANLKVAYLKDANLEDANLNGANLVRANLNGADLKRADLRDVDLKGAYLRGADLKGANLDYSCLPLWCGSLKAHFDNRQVIQILYHLLSVVTYSKNVSEEIRKTLLTPELCELANKFHRVIECGKIEALVKEIPPELLQQ